MGDIHPKAFVPWLEPGTIPENPPPPQRSRGASCRWPQMSPMSRIQSTRVCSSSWGTEQRQHPAREWHQHPTWEDAGSRVGCQNRSGTVVIGTQVIDGDMSHRGEGPPAAQPQGAVLWDGGGSGGPGSDTLRRGRTWVLGGPSAQDGVPPPACSTAERGPSSLEGAARDGVPHRGDVPPTSHPPGTLPGSPLTTAHPLRQCCAGLRG